ncbi:MAG: recombinase family protein, partial [Myxococcota bacterium]
MRTQKSLKDAQIAIYARFSSDMQSETSIDDQIRRCHAFIEQAGGDPARATVFPDYAVSGASLARPGFEAMMSAVEAGHVEIIVTEDISRISRDFADAAVVFRQLRYAQVPLISVADGINTSNRDAKLSFTLKSLVADIYLDDLRDKTLRGMEGKAFAGYATGKLPFGYRSYPDRNPAGRVLGHRIEIDAAQAELVRRIFTMYRDGKSFATIARVLNGERIPSPRAKTQHKLAGWGVTTIRAMLYNERYIGVWKFKENEWVRVPGTNRRRPRPRAESEVLRFERPELRIIDVELWNEVSDRLGATHRKYTRDGQGRPKGRARPSRRSPYLLSGVLRCGQCGAVMTIVGGSSASYYRCSGQRTKGICTNKLSVREEVARAGILRRLREILFNPRTLIDIRR